MGTMRDLGYHGALVQLTAALPLHSEIKLAFHLPRVDFCKFIRRQRSPVQLRPVILRISK